jgi:large subunit ribosomal protein L10
MAISKEKKQSIVASFEDMLKDAQSVVFVQFNKLTVKSATALRRKLRAEGVGYKVGKKTLLKRVLDSKGYQGELPPLEGEIAIAYSTDLLAPAREVYDFHKGNKDSVAIVGGIFEGSYKTKEEMVAIATIPGMQTLRGMFVNIINSPIQRFAIALDQVAKKKE